MKHPNLLIIIFSIFIFYGCSSANNKVIKEENKMKKTAIADAIIKDTLFIPQGVCSKEIKIHTENGIIMEVVFTKGCQGNTQAVSALIKGMTVEEAIKRLDGIQCGDKGTSCPDQLAQALKSLLNN